MTKVSLFVLAATLSGCYMAHERTMDGVPGGGAAGGYVISFDPDSVPDTSGCTFVTRYDGDEFPEMVCPDGGVPDGAGGAGEEAGAGGAAGGAAGGGGFAGSPVEAAKPDILIGYGSTIAHPTQYHQAGPQYAFGAYASGASTGITSFSVIVQELDGHVITAADACPVYRKGVHGSGRQCVEGVTVLTETLHALAGGNVKRLTYAFVNTYYVAAPANPPMGLWEGQFFQLAFVADSVSDQPVATIVVDQVSGIGTTDGTAPVFGTASYAPEGAELRWLGWDAETEQVHPGDPTGIAIVPPAPGESVIVVSELATNARPISAAASQPFVTFALGALGADVEVTTFFTIVSDKDVGLFTSGSGPCALFVSTSPAAFVPQCVGADVTQETRDDGSVRYTYQLAAPLTLTGYDPTSGSTPSMVRVALPFVKQYGPSYYNSLGRFTVDVAGGMDSENGAVLTKWLPEAITAVDIWWLGWWTE